MDLYRIRFLGLGFGFQASVFQKTSPKKVLEAVQRLLRKNRNIGKNRMHFFHMIDSTPPNLLLESFFGILPKKLKEHRPTGQEYLIRHFKTSNNIIASNGRIFGIMESCAPGLKSWNLVFLFFPFLEKLYPPVI